MVGDKMSKLTEDCGVLCKRIMESYHNLYRLNGVEPNTLLISHDLLYIFKTSSSLICHVESEGTLGYNIMGLNVILVTGTDVIKTAIVEGI